MVQEDKRLADLRFEALRNAIYHSARKSFLDKKNKFFSLIVILAGASAVGDLGTHFHIDAKWLAFVAAAAGSVQLVFDFGVRAREHDFLQRRYYELVAKIAESKSEDFAALDAELHRLYADEPAPMRALDAIAYNAASESLGKDVRVKVKWYHTLLSQCLPFNHAEFPYVAKPKSVSLSA